MALKKTYTKTWVKATVGASSKENMDERVRVHDGFHTPKIAVTTLLEKEDIADYVWDCCAGFFRIVKPLRKVGIKVITSDIVDWHGKIDIIKDFLHFSKPPKVLRDKTFDIVINPPYKDADLFVEHALKLLPVGGRLYVLLRIQFLEGNKRHLMFKKHPPKNIWVYSFRLPRMRRFFFKGKDAGTMLAFCWIVWHKGHKGSTVVDWIGR